MNVESMGDRLTAGHQTLDLVVEVRILLPQHRSRIKIAPFV